jgi:hypothetical protein
MKFHNLRSRLMSGACQANVRSWRKSGRHLRMLSVSQFDPDRTFDFVPHCVDRKPFIDRRLVVNSYAFELARCIVPWGSYGTTRILKMTGTDNARCARHGGGDAAPVPRASGYLNSKWKCRGRSRSKFVNAIDFGGSSYASDCFSHCCRNADWNDCRVSSTAPKNPGHKRMFTRKLRCGV